MDLYKTSERQQKIIGFVSANCEIFVSRDEIVSASAL